MAEAYRKREYPKHLHLKMTDCLGENDETQGWLDIAKEREYISRELYIQHANENEEIDKRLTFMMNNPGKFGVNP